MMNVNDLLSERRDYEREVDYYHQSIIKLTGSYEKANEFFLLATELDIDFCNIARFAIPLILQGKMNLYEILSKTRKNFTFGKEREKE